MLSAANAEVGEDLTDSALQIMGLFFLELLKKSKKGLMVDDSSTPSTRGLRSLCPWLLTQPIK